MARKVKVDMTGVESYSKASEGIHTAKVAEILEKTSQGGDDMLQFAFEIIKGEDKGSRVFESFVLTDKALWKLKSFLQAVGMKADGKLVLDLDKLIGKICDIEVFHEEYNGQKRAKISDYYKVGKGGSTEDEETDSDDEDEEEDEAPAKKPSKKAAAKKDPAPKGKKKPVEEDDEDEDEDFDEDEDEEDEEPAPKKKSKKKPEPPKKSNKPAKGKKKPEPEDEDEDDDDDWEEDD